jgi:hypothetical protein
MDADGEDKPSDIPRLLAVNSSSEEPRLVFASRRHRQEGLRFRVFYGLYKRLLYLLTGSWIDFGNFSVVPSSSLSVLTLYNELWRHYPATVICTKLPYQVIPCDRGQRYSGKSHMSLPSLVVHGLQSISLFSHNIAARLLLVCATLLMFPFLGIIVVVLVRTLTDLAIPGWATYVTGIMLVAILQLLALVLLFAFLILTVPRQAVLEGSSIYKTLIDSIQIIGCKHD